MNAPYRFDVFEDKRGQYRWRLIAPNGRRVATSGEAFAGKWEAERATDDVIEGIARLIDAELEASDVVVADSGSDYGAFEGGPV